MSALLESQPFPEPNAASSSRRLGKRDYAVAIALAIIHLGAVGIFFPAFFSWEAIAVAFALYWITGFGISLSYHRLLTHRSFTLPKPIEYFVALCGVLALQGGPIEWVATHRAHHANTDRDGDPHDANQGMPWAHFEWLYRRNKDRVLPEDRGRWVPDLLKEPYYVFLERHNVALQVLLGVALYAAGGWPFVVWALFARLVFTYHCTWLVNSAAHAVGYQSFKTGDRSTNNWFVALISFGEGWHNNHHAFPFSARHGLKRREIDLSWYIILSLKALHIARNVKLPSREMMERLKAPPRKRSFSA